ncbi:MAG: nucleoside transporter C-terminal domain-containing protein, partial [Pseudomonadota bacterium]
LVRPYLAKLGRGALFAIMVVGMATVAGTVLAIYAGVLSAAVPDGAGHLIAASVMNVPGALLLARLCVPDGFSPGPNDGSNGDGAPNDAHNDPGPTDVVIALEDPPQSTMDAFAQGVIDGLQLVATVAAMLIAAVALVALVNASLATLPDVAGAPLSLQRVFGRLFFPLALIIGLPVSEAATGANLLGQKLVLNEFLAYLNMAAMLASDPTVLGERSRLIMTYALCGFANLGSLGILIGGLATMQPDRRAEIAALAPRAVLIGFLTSLMSAAIVGCITAFDQTVG